MSTLRFPYAWSNPSADNDVVLANALLRPRFTDLILLMRKHGEDSLFSTLRTLISSGELSHRTATETEDMLRNIAAGVHDFERAHPSA